MIDNYVLDKVLDKTKELIAIEKFDDTKILIDTDDTLPEDIKDDDKFYPTLFLDEALLEASGGRSFL